MRVDMKPWRISKDEILAIARRKGVFFVPKYLYRAEGMANKCRELVKEGKLRRDRKNDGKSEVAYRPVKENDYEPA